MSNFILCLECKTYLGKYKSFIEAYNMSMKMLNNKLISSVNPAKIDISPDIVPDMKDLLDALNFKNSCCRTHILTSADFYKYLLNRTEL